MTMLQAARKYVSAGLNPIPVAPKTKKAQVAWGRLQRERPDSIELASMFERAEGIAVICGQVSGFLEVIDFDAPELYHKWRGSLGEGGHGALLDGLVVQGTPRGGYHVAYRCKDGIAGNMKLAMLLPKDEAQVPFIGIETRGEGGYVLAWPTDRYTILQGSWGKLPDLDGEEREALLAAARRFGETNDRPHTHAGPEEAVLPGDEWAQQAAWAEVLEPHGWTRAGKRGEEEYWTRPGKQRKDGHGATTNYRGSGVLKVFTDNAHPFEANATYSKFYAFALLQHGGDMAAAGRALRAKGFGNGSRTWARRAQPGRQARPEISTGEDRDRQRWLKLSGVESREVSWLWEPRIPIGEVTLVGGMPGVGKSTLMQAVATQTTLGAEIDGKRLARGEVVFLSAEQGLRTVTRPRFEQMGADLSMITCPDEETEGGEVHPFVLDVSGMSELKGVVRQTRAKLVVVDTCTKYFEAQRDFNSAPMVREWMARLVNIARTCECAVVLSAHINKATGQDPLYRISGSVDFVGASRCALLCGKDPDDEGRHAVAHIKSNVGPLAPSLGYSLRDGVFGWTGSTELGAVRMCEAPQTAEARERREECADWLRGVLADGPMGAKDMERLAKAKGFGWRIVKDAKKVAGIRSERDRFGKEGSWQWRLAGSGDDGLKPWAGLE